MKHEDEPHDPDLDELERLSNGALDLIRARRFEDAERVCKELRRRFPDELDWIDRTATLHDARGEIALAIDHYRQCIVHVRGRADEFDPECEADYRFKIQQLESRLVV